MNIIGITGNLTKDPELRRTETGKAVATFTVAVKRPHTSDKTDFIRCVAWNKTAEFISKYFSKGSGIVVDGYLTIRQWEDKEGNKRSLAEVICDNVGFMGAKKSEGSSSSYTEPDVPAGEDYTMIEDDDSDLPF